MNRSILAGLALVAGIAVAAPTVAWSADAPPPASQSAPIIPPMGQSAAGGGGMMGGMAGGQGMGAMGTRDDMQEMMRRMMMRGMAQLSPQQRCEERLARRAAMIAYTVTRLDLTAAQRPLWDKVNAIVQAAIDKQQQLCAALKDQQAGKATILDRVDRAQQFLAARLQALQQVRPALQQLYQALTPEQKAVIDHPFRQG